MKHTPLLSRRAFNTGVAAGLAGAALPFAPIRAQESTPASHPRGGVLRVGILGSGTEETLDPIDVSSMAKYLRATVAYEPLITIDAGELQYVLAEEATPNDDGSVWTFTLKEGIAFQNGQPLTAEDALYNFVSNPSPFALAYLTFLLNIDPEQSRVVDDRTFEVALLSPDGAFPNNLWALSIVPGGMTDTQTVVNGTSPFTLESFTPGDRAVYKRIDQPWRGDHQAYLDGIEVVVINDADARFNALMAGQIDVAVQISASHGQQILANDDFALMPIVSGTRHTPGFTMRWDTPPFDDPEVRLALRLAVDRQQMLDTIGFGRGSLGADTHCVDSLYYDTALTPRERDFDRAKSIIEAKGLAGTPIEIYTSPAEIGFVETSTLFAETLNQLGFEATLNVVPADAFWMNLGTLADAPLKSSVSALASFLEFATYTFLTNGAFNYAGYSNPEVDAMIQAAIATLDGEERRTIVYDLQAYLWEDGPDIVPVVLDTYHGLRAGVSGITTPVTAQYPDLKWAYIAE